MVDARLISWRDSGTFIPHGANGLKIFTKSLGNADATANNTLLIIHGFPESSFSFHKVLDGLSKIFDRIVLLDLPGYGWSDKPTAGYTYSLMEQADAVFTVWRHLGVSGGHLLSHDMGDSVATEILARHELGIMPSWFADHLQSLTFTNGSMVLDMARLRITQKILLSRYGYLMRNVVNYKIFNQQIKSAHGNGNLPEQEIQLLWQANCLQEGHRKTFLTIKYLNDRKRFENTRWLPALGQTKLPIHLCWGDDDAVAKVEMAHHLKKNVCTDASLTIMKGVGHFCQLGSPDQWLDSVGSYYSRERP